VRLLSSAQEATHCGLYAPTKLAILHQSRGKCMKFQLKKTEQLGDVNTDCLVLVCQNKKLAPSVKKHASGIYTSLNQSLSQSLCLKQCGDTFSVNNLTAIKAKSVLVIQLEDKEKITRDNFRQALHQGLSAIKGWELKQIALLTHTVKIKGQSTAILAKDSLEIAQQVFYRFDTYQTKKTARIQSITLLDTDNDKSGLHKSIQEARALCSGIRLAKDLANTPPNICTPRYLASQARQLAKKHPKLTAKVLGETEMKKLGMGALLGVGQGSAEPTQLICLHYQGGKKGSKPIAFVGKGVTFDTGGYNLKSSASIVGMKYDMCGAASVLGLMQSIIELKLPINVVVVVAAVENMVSDAAQRPEDIVTTMSGKTVEILNTDAEGRLALSDALTYTVKTFKPYTIIDLATLTGAMCITLGHVATGYFSNNDALASALKTASEQSADKAWQLPLWDEYQSMINSPFADIANIGDPYAGSITAACFLSRFVEDTPWAHLDIAGSAAIMGGKNSRKATGRPIPLLLNYLLNEIKNR
jgi:leucyl aminopeptidase